MEGVTGGGSTGSWAWQAFLRKHAALDHQPHAHSD